MQFANSGWLWVILCLPIFWIAIRKTLEIDSAKMEKHFGKEVWQTLTVNVDWQKRKLKRLFVFSSLFFMLLALARLQEPDGKQVVKSEGIELLFLFDVSSSMLAEDLVPSRIEVAKKEVSRFLDLSGAHRVGLVAFAGSSVLLSPLTNDRDAIKMYLESLSPDAVETQGTNIGQALKLAEDVFMRGGIEGGPDTAVTKAIVVVSDGEDQEPGALAEAKVLRDRGVRIFSLILGTEAGGAIPLRDEAGNLRGYKRDKAGQVIMSATKGTILKDLASGGDGGAYAISLAGNGVELLQQDIEKLQKSQFESGEVRSYTEWYQIFALLSLIALVLSLYLSDRKIVTDFEVKS
jgi:Ca-activated chloride channel family protein